MAFELASKAGKNALEVVKIVSFSLARDCDAHNDPAQAFYRAMGGAVIEQDTGHKNKQEDQLTFEFKVHELHTEEDR